MTAYTYLLEYQLRIRNRADAANLLTLTSVRGGTNPYIAEDGISGDGSSFNPLTGACMASSYTVRVVDEITSGTARVVTSQIEDASSQIQLGYLKAYLEFRRDGGSWEVACAGFVVGMRLISNIEWEINVQDALRVQGGYQLFSPTSSQYIAPTNGASSFLAAWPNRGCLVGGPLGTAFPALKDGGGWRMKVHTIAATGSGSSATNEKYWLEQVNVYPPGPWTENTNVHDFADIINDPIRDRLGRTSWTFWAAKTLSTVADTFDGMWWDGLVALVAPDDGTDFVTYCVPFRPIPSQVAGVWGENDRGNQLEHDLVCTIKGKEGIFIYKDGQSALTDNAFVRVRVISLLPSDLSPIYITQHPVDLLTTLYAQAGITVNSTAASNLKKQLGNILAITLRITSPWELGALVQQSVLQPFGIGVRLNASGEIVPFSTRIDVKTNAAPTRTITSAMVDEESVSPFDLDVSNALHRFSFKQKFLAPSRRATDGVIEVDQEITRLNASSTAFPSGTVDIECAGAVHLSDGEPFEPLRPSWVDGIALPLFDRFGHGAQSATMDLIRGSGADDADLVTLGEELLVQLPALPNHNKRYSDDTSVGSRAMQVTQLTEMMAKRRIVVIDSGPNAQPYSTKPTHTIAASTDNAYNIAELTITNAATLNAVPAGVRVQMATGASPTADDYTDVSVYAAGSVPTGAIRLRAVVPGTKVSVRARTELPGYRPSDYSTAVSVTLTAISPVTSLTAASVASDGSLEDLAWTAAANLRALVLDIFVRPSASAFTEARFVRTIQDTSVRFRLEGLTPNTQYKATVRYRDVTTENVSANTEVTFTTANTTYALAAPSGEVGFSNGLRGNGIVRTGMEKRDSSYGIAVYASEFPGIVAVYEAVETSIGGGSYGSFVLVGRPASVSGDYTVWTGFAPNDGKRRQLKARHEGDGRTASSYTSTLTVSPWTPSPLTPTAIPQASLQVRTDGFIEIRYDGPSWVQSIKWYWSTSAIPTDATTLASGTAQDGRTATVTTGGGIGLGTTVYVTIIPFSGLAATGTAGPSIHLLGSYQDFTAIKSVYFGANSFVAFDANTYGPYFQTTNAYIECIGLSGGGAPQAVFFRANLQVPSGVTISGIAAELYTDGSDGAASFTLYRTDTSGARTSTLAAVNSTVHGGWETKTASLSESTSARRYQLVLQLGTDLLGTAATSRCAGYSITYTSPSVINGL